MTYHSVPISERSNFHRAIRKVNVKFAPITVAVRTILVDCGGCPFAPHFSGFYTQLNGMKLPLRHQQPGQSVLRQFISTFWYLHQQLALADEITVIVLKDLTDAADAVKSLQKHVQGRVDMYKFYEPDQAKRAENAVIFSHGRCAVLIISDKPETARGVFEKAVTGGQK